MKVRVPATSNADRKSSQVFFDALTNYYDFSETDALDMFARNGQLTVSMYKNKVRSVEAWELGEEHEPALRDLGCKAIRIGCSYEAALMPGKRFGLVVIDSPQGAHKDFSGAVRFEHFHAIKHLKALVTERSVVVLYVNKQPYDKRVVGDHGYDQYDEYDFDAWMEARRRFYHANPLNLTEFEALGAYEDAVKLQGFRLVNVLQVPCYSDVAGKDAYAYRIALELLRS